MSCVIIAFDCMFFKKLDRLNSENKKSKIWLSFLIRTATGTLPRGPDFVVTVVGLATVNFSYVLAETV